MHTAAMYREMAEECFKWAATAVTDEARATYLSIAQIWLQAARLDGGLPIRGARLPDPPAGNGEIECVSWNILSPVKFNDMLA